MAKYLNDTGLQHLVDKVKAWVEAKGYLTQSALNPYRTSSAQDAIDNAQNTAIGEKYTKPSTGIPKTDLASGVQSSLEKADTALQQHQSLANYYTKAQTDAAISGHHDSTKQNVYQAQTVSLPVASWSNKQQTVNVTGVTASNLVQVAPNPSTFTEYCDAQIVCTAQDVETLIFKCETVPTVAISVNVVIW